MADDRFFTSIIEHEDIDYLREKELLRSDIDVGMDRQQSDTFGQAYDSGANVAFTTFESRKGLQQRCREFARDREFSLRVASNSWRKNSQEGNAKYVCKQLKGQQQLVPGSLEWCPWYITVYGLRDEWKITRICLAHDHYRHTGFQVDTLVESTLAEVTTPQRQRDVPFSTLQNVLEREMLPAYSGAWFDATGKAVKDFLKSKGYTVNRQTISQLKSRLLESHQGDMIESYQKLEDYLSEAGENDAYSSFRFDKTEAGVFRRACFSLVHAFWPNGTVSK